MNTTPSHTPLLTLLLAGCVAGVFGAGCSSGGVPSIAAPDRAAAIDAPAFAGPPPKVKRALFVSDLGNEVFVLRGSPYRPVREIKRDVRGSDGIWVDRQGDLYVTNVNARNVTEYRRRGRLPVCRYSDKLIDPIDVTTDDEGNVYVVDFNDFRAVGYIDEYRPCRNKTVVHREVVNGPEGIAVDSSGDVFVAYYNGAFGGFEEFLKGQRAPKLLRASVTQPGGIVLDKNDNLIADDQAGSIDLIPPPYARPKLLVGGLSDPFRLALNRSETLLFSADSGSASVTIYAYPSGSLVETVSGNGIAAVEGVAVAPDAVF